MTVFYFLIPLFAVAVAVAVLPVLYGTLKHQDWEKREAALTEQQQTQIADNDTDSDQPAQTRESRAHVALHDAHTEAVALLRRVEHLREQLETESERSGVLQQS